MKCLVIGATGIIGNHIVRELIHQGHDVIAGSRGVTPSLNLENLKIEKIKVDLADRESLEKAFQNVDWVFQAAAYYPRNMYQEDHHVRLALAEVHNITRALRHSPVKRLVYTSSLTTIGQVGANCLATEDHAYNLIGHDPHPYFLVKYLCEQEIVESAQKQNLPIVVVNPSGCFGPYELKPKQFCLIPQLVSQKMPVFVDHKINVVDAADVAKGHVLAAQKGALGERYILGGHNTTVSQVVKEICHLAKVSPPWLAVPMNLGLAACFINEYLSHRFFKSLPRLPILGLRFVQYGQHFSIDKAGGELGYKPHSMRGCYERAVEWFKKIGYC